MSLFLQKKFSPAASRTRRYRQRGFTLIEIIAVLVLLGIGAAFGGMFITQAVQGFMMTRSSTELSQKAQIALSRLSMELENASDITDITSVSSIDYTFRYPPPIGDSTDIQRVVRLVGTDLKIRDNAPPDINQGSILIDRVSSFQLKYSDADDILPSGINDTWKTQNGINTLFAITVTLVLNHPDPTLPTASFTTRIYPRRAARNNGPRYWNR